MGFFHRILIVEVINSFGSIISFLVSVILFRSCGVLAIVMLIRQSIVRHLPVLLNTTVRPAAVWRIESSKTE